MKHTTLRAAFFSRTPYPIRGNYRARACDISIKSRCALGERWEKAGGEVVQDIIGLLIALFDIIILIYLIAYLFELL